MAKYFGHDLNIYKNKKLNNILKALPTKTEELCKNAKEKLQLEAEKLGLNNNINAIYDIEKRLLEFDIEARTVDSIVFLTREEAVLAREEKIKIENVISEYKDELTMLNQNREALIKTNMLSVEDLERRILNIKNAILDLNCKTKIVDKYINQINDFLNEVDVGIRTLDGNIYETREEVKLIISERAYLSDVINKVNHNDEESIKLAIYNIESYNFKNIAFSDDLETLKKDLYEIDIALRTVGDILFETRRDASIARIEKTTIDKIERDIDGNNEESIKKFISKIEENNLKTVIAKNKIKELNRKLDDMDTEAKMVDGIFFETRKEAVLARKEKEDILKSIQHVDIKSEEGLIEAKRIINSKRYETKIANAFVVYMEKEIQGIYSEIINTASKYKETKDLILLGLIGSVIIPIIYISFFLYSGFITHVVIGFFFLACIATVWGETKEMIKVKKAVARMKKLKKQGKI